MVLSRPFLLALLAAAGCGESLFDAHGKRDGGPGDGGPDGPEVPRTCPDDCLGDAAANFPTGESSSGVWSYLEDTRDRSWTSMVVAGDMATGRPGNGIKRCSADPTAPGCQERPQALLISSAGTGTTADPALEFQLKAAAPRTIRLAFWAQSSADHTIHLYRNSREDLLHRASTGPDRKAEHSVLVDALPGDRFLIAVEPMSTSGSTVALDFFIYDDARDPAFPFACQLAVSFADVSGTVLKDLCTNRDLSSKEAGGLDTTPTIENTGGPLSQQDSFARVTPGYYLRSSDAARFVRGGQPLTFQFWVRLDTAPPTGVYAWAISDFDVNYGGGSGVGFLATPAQIMASGDTEPGSGANPGYGQALFPTGTWHFVRMIESVDTLKLCVDGAPVASLEVAADRPETMDVLYVGKATDTSNDPPIFDGAIDDLRVFAGALPCDPP